MSSNHDTLATLATVSTEVEAQLLVNILNDHGIAAVATGGFTAQFLAEAPGVVRVQVKQDNLSVARSVLAERDQEHWLEPADENAESAVYEPRLTRFGIRCVLIMALLYIVGMLAAWGTGANVVGGSVAIVVALVVIAAVLTRPWLQRKSDKGLAA
jgi:hypothetical protein